MAHLTRESAWSTLVRLSANHREGVLLAAVLVAPYLALPFPLRVLPAVLFVFAPGALLVSLGDPDVHPVTRTVAAAGCGLALQLGAVAVGTIGLMAVGFARPLDPPLIFLGPTLATASLYAVWVRRARTRAATLPSAVDASATDLAVYAAVATLPAVAASGTHVLDQTGWNGVSIAFYVLCITVVAALVMSERTTVAQYATAAYGVSLGFVLAISLRTPAVVGADVHKEVRTLHRVLAEGQWLLESTVSSTDTVGSIKLLGPLLVALFDLSPVIVFKLAYPFVIVLAVPAAFLLFRTVLPDHLAFGAVILTTYHITFWAGIHSNNRMGVALVFVMLFLLSLLAFDRYRYLPPIFGAGIVVSHYTVAVLFLTFFVSTVVGTAVFRLVTGRTTRIVHVRHAALILLFAFVWYEAVHPGLLIDLFRLAIVKLASVLQQIAPWIGVGSVPGGGLGGGGGIAGTTDVTLPDRVIIWNLFVEFGLIGLGLVYVALSLPTVAGHRPLRALGLHEFAGYRPEWLATERFSRSAIVLWIMAIVAFPLFAAAYVLDTPLATSRVQAQLQFVYSVLLLPGLFVVTGLLLQVFDFLRRRIGSGDPLLAVSPDRLLTVTLVVFLVGGLVIQTGLLHLAMGESLDLNLGGPTSSNKYVEDGDLSMISWFAGHAPAEFRVFVDHTGDQLMLSTDNGALAERLAFRVESAENEYALVRSYNTLAAGDGALESVLTTRPPEKTLRGWGRIYDAGRAEIYHRPG